MNRKKTMWVVIGVVAVAIVSAVVLIKVFLHDRNGDTKREPTPTIPAEIPAGSVLVWRRNAEYFTKNDEKERLLYKYQYDEYGRCVRREDYDDPEDRRKVTRYTVYQYDDATMQTTEIEVREVDQEHADRYVTVYDQTGEKIGWIVWTYEGEFDDYVKQSEAVWERNAFGEYVYAADITYYRTGSISTIRWRSYDEETRTEYWKSCSFGTKGERQDKGDWRSIAESAVVDVLLESVTEYDPQGRVLRTYSVDCLVGEPEERKLTGEATIASDGTRTMTTYVDDGGKTVTVYDAGERVIQRTFYNSDGTIDRESKYTYEELASGGRRETMESFDGAGNLQARYVEEFNSNDQTVLRTGTVDGEETVLARVVFDEKGRKIRWERPYQIAQYEYDEYGNYVKMIFDLENPDYPTHEFTDFVMHPLVLEQDKVEHGKEFYCPVDFEP